MQASPIKACAGCSSQACGPKIDETRGQLLTEIDRKIGSEVNITSFDKASGNLELSGLETINAQYAEPERQVSFNVQNLRTGNPTIGVSAQSGGMPTILELNAYPKLLESLTSFHADASDVRRAGAASLAKQ